jgi:phosphoserine phosphatase
MMLPLAAALGVPATHIFANDPVWDGERLVGFQPGPLLSNDGKAKVLALLKETGMVTGKTMMIGDGMGDLKTYLLGIADDFFGAGFHAVRPNVKAKAPHFFMSVQEMREFLSL